MSTTTSPVQSSEPGPSDASLSSFLQEEPTKILLAQADAQGGAWRTAVVLLLSACAYVGVTAFGHVHAEESRSLELSAADTALRERRVTLDATRKAEFDASRRYREASDAAEALEDQIGSLAAGVAYSERSYAEASKERDEAERIRAAEKNQEQAELGAQKLKFEKARADRAAAQRRIEEFKRKDAESRYEWDRRRSEVPAELTEELKRAESEVAKQKDANHAALTASRAKPITRPAAGASAPLTLEKPLTLESRRLKLLNESNAAKDTLRTTENAWQLSERDLRTAEEAHAAAQAERDRMGREPDPLALPILGVAVSPKVFFALAPLLLLTLYLHAVAGERMLARTASAIITRAASRSVAREGLALYVPVLRMGRVRFLAAHLLFGLMLVSAPLLFGKWRLPFVILLVGVLVCWSVWGLVAFLQHRRQTPKTGEPPRRGDAGTATEKPTVVTSPDGSSGDQVSDRASATDGDS